MREKNFGGRVVSASGSATSVLSSTPTSAIIYDAYTTPLKTINKKFRVRCLLAPLSMMHILLYNKEKKPKKTLNR